MQSQIARRSDVHCGTFAHRFHPAQHFDRVGVIVVLRSTVVANDRSHNSVFGFCFYDGSMDLFGSHSAPSSTSICHTQTARRAIPPKTLLDRVPAGPYSAPAEPTSSD